MEETEVKNFTIGQLSAKLHFIDKDDLNEQLKRLLHEGVLKNNEMKNPTDLRGTISIAMDIYKYAELKNIENTWRNFDNITEFNETAIDTGNRYHDSTSASEEPINSFMNGLTGRKNRSSITGSISRQGANIPSKTSTIDRLVQSLANNENIEIDNEVNELINCQDQAMFGQSIHIPYQQITSPVDPSTLSSTKYTLKERRAKMLEICINISEARTSLTGEAWFSCRMVEKEIQRLNLEMFITDQNYVAIERKKQQKKSVIRDILKSLCQSKHIGTNEKGIIPSDLRYRLWIFDTVLNDEQEDKHMMNTLAGTNSMLEHEMMNDTSEQINPASSYLQTGSPCASTYSTVSKRRLINNTNAKTTIPHNANGIIKNTVNLANKSDHRHTWNNQQVIKWLETINYHQYINKFKAEEIQGFSLDLLTSENLKELGMSTVNSRVLFEHYLKELRELQD